MPSNPSPYGTDQGPPAPPPLAPYGATSPPIVQPPVPSSDAKSTPAMTPPTAPASNASASAPGPAQSPWQVSQQPATSLIAGRYYGPPPGQAGDLVQAQANGPAPGDLYEYKPTSGNAPKAGEDFINQQLDQFKQRESGGQNIRNAAGGPDSGLWQDIPGTWKEAVQLGYGSQADAILQKYPEAINAPDDVQRKANRALYDKYGDQPWWSSDPRRKASGNRAASGSGGMTMTAAGGLPENLPPWAQGQQGDGGQPSAQGGPQPSGGQGGGGLQFQPEQAAGNEGWVKLDQDQISQSNATNDAAKADRANDMEIIKLSNGYNTANNLGAGSAWKREVGRLMLASGLYDQQTVNNWIGNPADTELLGKKFLQQAGTQAAGAATARGQGVLSMMQKDLPGIESQLGTINLAENTYAQQDRYNEDKNLGMQTWTSIAGDRAYKEGGVYQGLNHRWTGGDQSANTDEWGSEGGPKNGETFNAFWNRTHPYSLYYAAAKAMTNPFQPDGKTRSFTSDELNWQKSINPKQWTAVQRLLERERSEDPSVQWYATDPKTGQPVVVGGGGQ